MGTKTDAGAMTCDSYEHAPAAVRATFDDGVAFDACSGCALCAPCDVVTAGPLPRRGESQR